MYAESVCSCIVFYQLASNETARSSSPRPPHPGMARDRQLPLPVDRCQHDYTRNCILEKAYPDGALSSQFPLQTSLEFSRERYTIRVGCFDRIQHGKECRDEGSNLQQALSWRHPCVFVGCEHAQNVVVLVQRLAKILSLLLVPPVTVRVSELPLDWRGLNVTAVL